jgi:hypothetical protein
LRRIKVSSNAEALPARRAPERGLRATSKHRKQKQLMVRMGKRQLDAFVVARPMIDNKRAPAPSRKRGPRAARAAQPQLLSWARAGTGPGCGIGNQC